MNSSSTRCARLAERAVAYLGHLPQPPQRAWRAEGRQQVTFNSHSLHLPKATKPPFPVRPPKQDQKGLPQGCQHPAPPPLAPSPCGHILQLLQLLQHSLGQQPALLWGRGESGGHRHRRHTHTHTNTHPGPARSPRGQRGTFCSANSSWCRRRFSFSSSRCLRGGGSHSQTWGGGKGGGEEGQVRG